MTEKELETMNEICAQLQTEKDHRKFSDLLKQLNELVERKADRLEKQSHE